MTLNPKIALWLTETRVIDGAFGTEAARLSRLKIDGHASWSSRLIKDDPELVRSIHESFLKAGCDIICTNTYQASTSTLANSMDIGKKEAAELMRHSVRIARRAIDNVRNEEKKCLQLNEANQNMETCGLTNAKRGRNSLFNRLLEPLIAGSL
ncbi:unnamed protein product, partial [Protopolystoma xenopodis]